MIWLKTYGEAENARDHTGAEGSGQEVKWCIGLIDAGDARPREMLAQVFPHGKNRFLPILRIRVPYLAKINAKAVMIPLWRKADLGTQKGFVAIGRTACGRSGRSNVAYQLPRGMVHKHPYVFKSPQK